MVVITDSPDYEAKIETIDFCGEPAKCFHMQVNKWTPKVYKELKKAWDAFRKEDSDILYAVPADPKVAKFARKFGFQYFGRTQDGDKIYIHEVKHG